MTAAEKKLLELYRKADAQTKKEALKVLKGEDDGVDDLLTGILETVVGLLDNK